MKKHSDHYRASEKVLHGQAGEVLYQSEKKFKELFEDSPVSLWVEDFSAVKQYIEKLRESGIDDMPAYFTEHSGAVRECVTKLKIVDVNKATLTLYDAETKDQLLTNLQNVFVDESFDTFRAEILALIEGQLSFETESVTRSLRGAKINIIIRWSIGADYSETWERVMVSIVDITDRKQMEEKLKQAVEKNSTLYTKTPAMLHSIDRQRRLVSVSDAWLEKMGYSREEVLGHKSTEFLTETSREYATSIVLPEFFATGECNEIALQFVTKSGEIMDVLLSATSEKDESGQVIRSLAIITDITDKKRADEALKQSETYYRSLFNNSLYGFVVTGPDFKFQQVNNAFCELLEYSAEELVGQLSISDVTAPEDRFTSKEKLAQLVRGDIPYFLMEKRYVAKSGKYIECLTFAQGNYDENGLYIRGTASIFNITEQKRAELALKESEDQLRLIANQMPGALWTTDTNLLFTSIYGTGLKEAGMLPNEILGLTIANLNKNLPNLANLENYHLRALSGEKVNFESNFLNHAYLAHVEPFRDSRGDIVGVLGVAIDNTTRKQADKERRQIDNERQALLEKTLQISELKSNIIAQEAHEIKTPLTSVLGWAELLYNAKSLGKNLDDTFDLEDLESILRNAERINNLINDFLDVGRVESGQLELVRQSVDFSEILENSFLAVDYIAKQKNVKFQTELKPFPLLFVDRWRMEQVIINVLSNAIKYSPDETCVTIKTRTVNVRDRKMFRVLISDEGYGFTPEELAEATTQFSKAYTQQEQKRVIQGSGLGLFISRRIVEQHGGTLTIRSGGVDMGTEVEILLPLDNSLSKPKIFP